MGNTVMALSESKTKAPSGVEGQLFILTQHVHGLERCGSYMRIGPRFGSCMVTFNSSPCPQTVETNRGKMT